MTRGDPLTRVTAELIARRQASFIALESLGVEAVDTYLSRRFPDHGFPAKLTATIHHSTGGNPLFITTLVDDLEGKGLLRAREGRWELSTSVEDVAARRPDSIRRLIDTQIDRLPTLEQRILETAAVAGATFTAGVVAHTLDAEVDSVDSACESLANERRFLQFVGTETWPDGTIQSRYAFGHSLFQHAALTRSTSANVRAHHRKIAERLESGHAHREEGVAAELAVHFDRAQAPAKAAHYHVTAGDHAGHRHGVVEAITHYERACALLAALPESRERNLLEMRAKRILGWRLFQRDGSTDAALPSLERSRELATLLEEKTTLAEILLRLGSLCMVRGDMGTASQHVRAAAPLLHLLPDALRAFGNELEAITVLIQGNPREALHLLDEYGILRATAEQVVADRKGTHLTSMAYGSFALWLVGKLDDAVELVRRGYRVAELMDDPWEQAALLSDWAMLHAWRREPAQARELASRSLALAEQRAFGMWRHRADLVLRWAEAELSPVTSEKRTDELLNTRWECVALGRTQPSLLYAVLCTRLGRADNALHVISETLASLPQSEERWLEPELHRLRGAILAPSDAREAERSMVTAIEVAQRQASLSSSYARR